MSKAATLNIILWCEKCNTVLFCEKMTFGNQVVGMDIVPCPVCLAEAREGARQEGYAEGLEAGKEYELDRQHQEETWDLSQ